MPLEQREDLTSTGALGKVALKILDFGVEAPLNGYPLQKQARL